MEKKTYLLPHKCQTVGWWLLLLSLISIPVFITLDSHGHLANGGDIGGWVAMFIATCLPYIAIVLVCLSREKVEDEYINHLRVRSVFYVVVFAFIIGMLELASGFISSRLLTVGQMGQVAFYTKILTNPMILAVVYLLLFKGSILINTLKSNKDGQ